MGKRKPQIACGRTHPERVAGTSTFCVRERFHAGDHHGYRHTDGVAVEWPQPNPAISATLLVRCPFCRATKRVGPREAQPFCGPCGMPMLAESAEASNG